MCLVQQLCTCVGVSPVEDLQFSFTSNNSLLITWSSPAYFSNDIPVGSTISYDISLTNRTGNVIVNTTTTDTFIEVVNITICDTFNVSVNAILGQLHSSINTNRNNGSEYHSIFIKMTYRPRLCS